MNRKPEERQFYEYRSCVAHNVRIRLPGGRLTSGFSGGGTEEQIRSLGTTLILAGAIIIGAIIISSAILERSNRN